MALRVLLADDNITIKKVIQLSLQDYAVSVKSVNLGVDVLEVARGFQPDIVFADILLQKRNGYEVCADFKNDDQLGNIPFILMWSGFMELDADRFAECRADGQIEKPFDRNTLRQLVQEKVEKTQSNQISGYIESPALPTAAIESASESADKVTEDRPAERIKPLPEEKGAGASWSIDSFDDIGDFVQKPLSALSTEDQLVTSPSNNVDATTELDNEVDTENTWMRKSMNTVNIPIDLDISSLALNQDSILGDSSKMDTKKQKDLSKIKLNMPSNDASPQLLEEFAVDLGAADKVSAAQFVTQNHNQSPAQSPKNQSPNKKTIPPPMQAHIKTPQPAITTPPPVPQLSPQQLEKLIQAQSKDVIESIVWKIVPDLAEKIIREKLDQLMKDAEL